jgi:hypothetical protein
MASAICSRCQKIYEQANKPATCINCGGDVRTASAAGKPVANTSKPTGTQSGIPVKPTGNVGTASILPKPVEGTTENNENGCLTTFFMIIFSIIALGLIAFVGGFIIMQIVDFFSGLDTSDTETPYRFPFRRVR